MVVPPKSQDITFDEFLKELPAEYHEIAYEFKRLHGDERLKLPPNYYKSSCFIADWTMCFETQRVYSRSRKNGLQTRAVHKRLKACEPWLKALLTRLLPTVKNPSAPLRILVVDGSSLQGPGTKGTDYRLHLALDLVSMTLHEVHVTGADQGESLRVDMILPALMSCWLIAVITIL